ncbi:unnamed protein product, partial [marine sediment metagenome]
MNDIDFLRKMSVAKREKFSVQSDNSLVNTPRVDNSSQEQSLPEKEMSSLPHCNQIIRKVLFTRTEVIIYPNGDTYQKSQSWFEKGTQIVRKKVKPKPRQVKKV